MIVHRARQWAHVGIIGVLLSMLNVTGWIVPGAVAHEEEPDVSLIQNIDTSLFIPPIPDPSGIAYRNSSDMMAVIDSDVDDNPPLFTGDNVFDMSAAGILLNTMTTIPFSSQPTGVDRKSTRLNSSHTDISRMPSSA